MNLSLSGFFFGACVGFLALLQRSVAGTPYERPITLMNIVLFLAMFKLSNEIFGNDTIKVNWREWINKIDRLIPTDTKQVIEPDFRHVNLLGVGTNAGRLTDHLSTEFFRDRIRRVH